ncbi:MAG: tRNA (adenosine(37)-N6)-threonylcarbamoyltransferase complex dimerization subunit type 1 TsaB [Candidatus Hydrogenedentes bacterium]|nr:tRNA (adenosine(37)-N6)-threonylcarbamoyltransferase complex dimerization subunit type 1 TsaB [Candidatus Hydrogenedentota bacterium]
MPLILAADTSTAIYSIALCRDDALLAEAVIDGRRLHSERLLPSLQWLLGEAGLTLADVELLAIAIGPGSFTGLRIGAATWKGLALANDLPLVGVPTLDAMARLSPAPPRGCQAVLLDARMKEVFCAAYRFDGPERVKVLADRVCGVPAFLDALEAAPGFDPAEVSLLGDGAQLYREALAARWPEAVFAAPAQGAPRASAVALEALDLHARGASGDAGLVNPVYLRKSQAEVNRDKRLSAAPC